jgi:hypothetical protein
LNQQKNVQEKPHKSYNPNKQNTPNIFWRSGRSDCKRDRLYPTAVKVTGSNFAEPLVLGFLNKPKMSYRQMSQSGALSGQQIPAQGLEQKLGEGSAKFMQAMVSQLIKTSLDKDEELLNRFQRIHIQDGSVIGLWLPSE